MRTRFLFLAASLTVVSLAGCSSGSTTSTTGPTGPSEWDKLFAEAGGTPSDLQALAGLWVVTVDGNDVRLRVDATNLRFGMKCGGVPFGLSAPYQLKSKEPMPGQKRTGFRGDLTVASTQNAKGAGGELTCELNIPAGSVGYTVQDGKLYLTGVAATAKKAAASSGAVGTGGPADTSGFGTLPEFTKIGD